MPTQFFGIVTHRGEQKLAQAMASGQPLEITHMAVGDGGGSVPKPDPQQTALLGEKRRAPLNSLSTDKKNTHELIAEQIIPESDGDFWIRELGLFDTAGDLIAVANCPASFKPKLAQGSGKIQTIRMVIAVSSSAAVVLKVDPTVILATREYVDSADRAAAASSKAVKDALSLALEKIDAIVPIGVPLPFPLAAVPPPTAGIVWLKLDGAAFSKEDYPKLAEKYASGILPDLRGEVIRGWAAGRDVDTGRELLSAQLDALQNIVGAVDFHSTHTQITSNSGAFAETLPSNKTGYYSYNNNSFVSENSNKIKFDASKAARTAAETRMRNIAFNYIVRAA